MRLTVSACERPPSSLTDCAPALLQQTARVANGIGDVGVVAKEWEVADDVGAAGSANDGLDVVNHVVHAHRHGRIVAQNHLPKAVADQD